LTLLQEVISVITRNSSVFASVDLRRLVTQEGHVRNNAGIFAALFIVAVGSSVRAATVTWLYDGDGNWNTASSWSSAPSLPGVNDDVVISQPGPVTVSLTSGTTAVHSLVTSEGLFIQNANLSFAADSQMTGTLQFVSGGLFNNANLKISGGFIWSGGSLTGTGKTTLAAEANTTILGGALTQTIDNAGHVNMTGATSGAVPVLSFGGGTFNNLASGTFEYFDSVNTTTTIFAGLVGGTFNNAGEFNFSSFGFRTASMPFNNTGAINVYSGTLALSQGGVNSGVVNVFPNATLNSVGFTNHGTINVQGNGNVGSPLSGTLSNAQDGKINILSSDSTFSGNLTNSGEINITNGASLTLDVTAQNPGSKVTGKGTLILRNVPAFGGAIQTTGPVSIAGIVSFSADQELIGPVALGLPIGNNPQISGAGNVTIKTALNWTLGTMTGPGKTTLGPDSVNAFSFTGNSSLSRTLDNYGTVNHTVATAALAMSNNATINNLGTYNLNATSSGNPFSGSSSKFNNVGVLNIYPLNATGIFSMGVPVDNSGTINLHYGILNATINNTGTVNFLPAVSSNIFSTSITNAGVVNFSTSGLTLSSPQFVNTVAGQINFLRGTHTINSGSNAGKINISQGATVTLSNGAGQASGSSFNGTGTLNLSNVATYLGTLNVTGVVNLTGLINFNSPQNIPGTFTMTNGSLGGTSDVVFAGQFNWIAGSMQGAGKTSIAATATANITAGSLSRTLENSGQLNFLGGTSNFSFSNAALNNLPTGTVNVRGSVATFSGGVTTNSISNAGIWNLELTAPTNLFTENVPMSNSGALNVSTGTLALSGGGTNTGAINVYPRGQLTFPTAAFTNRGDINFVQGQQTWNLTSTFANDVAGQINVLAGKLTIAGTPAANSGKINVAAGAQFATAADYTQLAGSSINGAGDIALGTISNFSGAINSTGNIQLTSPITFNSDQNIQGSLIVSSGIGGPANIISTGQFTWQPLTASTLSGTGKITLKGTSVFGFTNFGTQLTIAKEVENAGVLNWNIFSSFLLDHGTLSNSPSGVINLNASTNGNQVGSNAGAINNLGAVNKVGAGSVALPLTNAGIVNVQQGALSLSGAQAGVFNVAQTATLSFTQPTFDPATRFTGSGALFFYSDTKLPGPNTFSGVTTILNVNTLELAHPLALQNSTLDLYFGKLDFGTLQSATLGSLRGGWDVSLQNQLSADVALTIGNNDASDVYSGILSGGGSLTKVGTGAFTLIGHNNYTGPTTVSAGTLLVSGMHTGGATYTVQQGARLSGVGNISSDVVLQPGGILAPGASPGKLTVGSLNMSTGSSLDIELGGTTPGVGFDQLNVTGAAALAGSLKVSFVNGFVPATDASFDILDAATIAGSFTNLNLPQLGGPFVWDPSQLYTTGVLSVVETFVAGDLNRDGQITAADLPAFLAALTNLDSYEAAHNLTAAELLTLADFNGSGSVTNADLQNLLDLIAAQPSGGGVLAAVPEPASLLSASVGLALIAVVRSRRSILDRVFAS
jgi:fibronectin-binding autotransporter adhesin